MEFYLLIGLNVIVILILFFRTSKNNTNNEDIEYLVDELKTLKENFASLKDDIHRQSKDSREELTNNLSLSRKEQSDNFQRFSAEFNSRSVEVESRIKELSKSNEERIDKLKESVKSEIDSFNKQVDNNLKELRSENEARLKEMQKTVDEKLQEALESRITKAFNSVSERLEKVHTGLGEMRNLASDVGDLKKVLSNVKVKGVLGEYQLENILEHVFAPSQYINNAQVKESSGQRVEFALKLPGRDDTDSHILLPIDSKFPTESYQKLITAYEEGNTDNVELYRKELKNAVKSFAKDISTKYINPPSTTDFAIMFLPVEGLYAEILRDPDLFQSIQRKYKVIITGPTTLAAFLNSLQIGFRTLALQKRSSEVWKILSEVKHEFEKFGEVLNTTMNQLDRAKKNLKNLVGTRTNQMQRKLSEVETLEFSEPDELNLIDLPGDEDE